MIFSLLCSLILPIVTGFFFTCLLWSTGRPVRSDLVLKSFFAIGLGFGISSSVFFLWLSLFGPPHNLHLLLIAELPLIIILATLLFLRQRPLKDSAPPPFHLRPFPKPGFSRILQFAFYFALSSAFVALVLLIWERPHGGWDAWAIWNLRARFIFRGGEHWRGAFSNLLSWSHPDYPLMIPGIVARGWTYVHDDTVLIPAVISLLFTAGTLGLLVTAVAMLRGKSQAFLAGLFLLGARSFIIYGAYQYADVPVGFFVLATIVLLSLHDRIGARSYSLVTLAGVTAGFAAWTKNEGLLFFICLIAAAGFTLWRTEGVAEATKYTAVFSVGAAPILAMIVYFKVQLAPPNDLLTSLQFHTVVQKLLDLPRYGQMATALMGELLRFGRGIVNPLFLLPLHLGLVGIQMGELHRRSIAIALGTLGLMMSTYAFVYLVTPYDIAWHIKTSLDRLLMQLWPSFLFACFLMVSPPAERLMEGGD